MLACARRGDRVAQIAVASRLLSPLPSRALPPELGLPAHPHPDSCAAAVPFLLPAAGDAAMDANFQAPAEAHLAALWEWDDDAGLAAGKKEVEQETEYLRRAAEGGDPAAALDYGLRLMWV